MKRISKEHDEERRRLELLFQVEQARQKEELRKRKEKKRRERLAKKTKAEDANSKDELASEVKGESAIQQEPPPRLLSPRQLVLPQSPRLAAMKAETKDDTGRQVEHDGLSVMVPGHGRMDLAHLLIDSRAKRFQDRKGLPPAQQQLLPAPQALLNPSTLRYLMEKMMKKDPTNWRLSAASQQQAIVLKETDPFAADEK